MSITGRSAWGYRQVRAIPSAPVRRQGLVVHHSVTPAWLGAQGARNLQQIHLNMGWAATGYNWLLDRNGALFEARPLNVEGAHTRGHNRTRHAVCLIGDHRTVAPSDAQISAVRWLYRHGQERGWWAASLTGHRDLVATACPGDAAYRRLSDMRRPPTTSSGGTVTTFDDVNDPRPEHEGTKRSPSWALNELVRRVYWTWGRQKDANDQIARLEAKVDALRQPLTAAQVRAIVADEVAKVSSGGVDVGQVADRVVDRIKARL